jgi:hypothetical protein
LRKLKQHWLHRPLHWLGFVGWALHTSATATAQKPFCFPQRPAHFFEHRGFASTWDGKAVAPSAAAPRADNDARRETVATAHRAIPANLASFIACSLPHDA